MSQKNIVLGVLALPEGTGTIPMVGNDGIAQGAGTLLAGAMPKSERPTNRSGSGAGLSKATRSDSWLVRVGIARESFTV